MKLHFLASIPLTLLFLAACSQVSPQTDPVSGALSTALPLGTLGTHYGEPVPKSLIVTSRGLEWVWASAVAHDVRDPNKMILLGHEGFKFATHGQWSIRPPASAFLGKCAAAWFSTNGDECNQENLAPEGDYGNAYGSAPLGDLPTVSGGLMEEHFDTLLVRRAQTNTAPDFYTLDFEKAAAFTVLYSVKTGRGISYEGKGAPTKDSFLLMGYRFRGGKKLSGNQARVITYGSVKELTVTGANGTTPNPDGGILRLKPPTSYSTFTLKSLTVSGVRKAGAFVRVTSGGKDTTFELQPVESSQTLEINLPNVTVIHVSVNGAFTVDHVVFEAGTRK